MAALPPPARKQTRLVFAAADDDAPGEDLEDVDFGFPRTAAARARRRRSSAKRPRRPRSSCASGFSWADLLRGRVHSSRRGGGAAPPVYDDDSGDDGGPKVAFVPLCGAAVAGVSSRGGTRPGPGGP